MDERAVQGGRLGSDPRRGPDRLPAVRHPGPAAATRLRPVRPARPRTTHLACLCTRPSISRLLAPRSRLRRPLPALPAQGVAVDGAGHAPRPAGHLDHPRPEGKQVRAGLGPQLRARVHSHPLLEGNDAYPHPPTHPPTNPPTNPPTQQPNGSYSCGRAGASLCSGGSGADSSDDLAVAGCRVRAHRIKSAGTPTGSLGLHRLLVRAHSPPAAAATRVASANPRDLTAMLCVREQAHIPAVGGQRCGGACWAGRRELHRQGRRDESEGPGSGCGRQGAGALATAGVSWCDGTVLERVSLRAQTAPGESAKSGAAAGTEGYLDRIYLDRSVQSIVEPTVDYPLTRWP